MAKSLGFLALGIFIGGALIGAPMWVLLQDAEARYLEAAQAAALVNEGVQLADRLLPIKGGVVAEARGILGQKANDQPVPIADHQKQVMELAKSYIEDRERQRVLRVYRATTPAFQKKTERKAFEDLVAQHKDLQNLSGESGFYRQMRINKTAGGKGFDVYFTDAESSSFGRKLVNVAMTFVQEGDEWRIDDFEITSSNKK